MNKQRLCYLVFLLSFLLISSGCGIYATQTSSKPYFTDPLEKIAQTSTSTYTSQMVLEALTLDPSIFTPGTKVYMGYWSPFVNRAHLVKVLDAINSSYSSSSKNKAIFDEGVTTSASSQYPSYIRTNDEFWYERGNAVGGIVTLTIEGVTYTYTDPHPVTFAQADTIWGQCSQRYADMATLIRRATGITPEAICFVQGAKSNRIFYSFELPELVSLEAKGDVKVLFAVTTEADWQKSSDWVEGTKNAPTPVAP